MTTLDKVDQLMAALNKLPQIKHEHQKELDKKFRLEFNYNSNHLEGNTLTYSETELLLIFDDTKGNHTMRELEEMKAHDVAFRLVSDLAKEKEQPLTEQLIKNLNEIILVRPFWKEAITPDGQNTRRLIKVGEYKEFPNSVRLQNGELFEYASPTETPIKMHELIEWYRTEEKSLHPVTLATILHYLFVCIHPFDDGNGRVARLLMNFVLIRNNYPPVVIKSKDKPSYLQALHLADVGNYEPFIEYIAQQVIWSLELTLKATKGESIEDAEDLDKKITLLQKEIEAEGDEKEIKVELSKDIIKQMTNEWIISLFTSLEDISKKFESFYFGINSHVLLNIDNIIVESTVGLMMNDIETNVANNKFAYKGSIQYKIITGPYKKGGAQPFSCNYNVEITLNQLYYEIGMPVFNQKTKSNDYIMIIEKRLLHKPLNETEKNKIKKLWSDSLFNYLDYNRKQIYF